MSDTQTHIRPTLAIDVPCVNCQKDPGEPCGVQPNGDDGFCLARLLNAACYTAATLRRIERDQ